jgi:hypothetical protein
MTKTQIVEIVAESARLVAEKKTGIAPRSEKHVKRLAELKQRHLASRSGKANATTPGRRD